MIQDFGKVSWLQREGCIVDSEYKGKLEAEGWQDPV